MNVHNADIRATETLQEPSGMQSNPPANYDNTNYVRYIHSKFVRNHRYSDSDFVLIDPHELAAQLRPLQRQVCKHQHDISGPFDIFGVPSPPRTGIVPSQTGGPTHRRELPLETSQGGVTKHATHSSSSHADLVASFVQRQAKINVLRDQNLQLRSKLDFEQQKLRDVRCFERESRKALVAALNPCSGNLHDLATQCERDFAEVEAQETVTTQLQNEVSNLEFRLMAEEQSLVVIIPLLLPKVGVNVADIGNAEGALSVSEEALTEIPSLLERYYDRKGDIGIYCERLQNLREDYLEASETRELLNDQGQASEISEEEFQRIYGFQRLHIVSELEAAKHDAQILAQQCMDAGIRIETNRPASSTGAESSEAPPIFPVAIPSPRSHIAARRQPSQQNQLSIFWPSTERLDQTGSLTEGNVHLNVNQWLANSAQFQPPECEHPLPLPTDDSLIINPGRLRGRSETPKRMPSLQLQPTPRPHSFPQIRIQ